MKITPLLVSHPPGFGYHKTNRSDESIVKAILNHDDVIIGFVYREHYQKIKKMVYTFRNTILNPDDIFQEGLTRAILNIREGKFRGGSSFLTYLNSICRNICLKEINDKYTKHGELKEYPYENDAFDFDILDQLSAIRKQLDEKCRTIIDLRFGIDEQESGNTISFEEIAGILGLTTDNARQRFKRCLDKLREYALNNNELKSLFYS